MLLGVIIALVLLFWPRTDVPTTTKNQPKPLTLTNKPEVSEVTIAPTSEQTVAGIYKVTVDVEGNAAKLELYVDGVLRSVTYKPPFGFELDTTTLANGPHTLLVKAYDKAGNSISSSEITIIVQNEVSSVGTGTPSGSSGTASTSGGSGSPGATPDSTPPGTPTNLFITATDSWTSYLTWTAPTDNVAVTGYRIYRDGVQVGTSAQANYSDLGSAAGNEYDYTVVAVDAAANTSGQSSPLGITLPDLTIWIDADIPGSRNDTDASAIELGFKFRPKVNGTITGVRFWKSTQDTGTHIGNLWTTGGTNLASATFVSESATGWQTVQFATPVNVTANTVYVASYHSDVGHYSSDANYFASAGFDNGYIEAVQSGVSGGNNGVFTYSAGSTFPTTASGNSSNYWVDVTFAPSKGVAATTRIAGGSPSSFQGYPDASTTGVPANTALIKHPRDIIIPAGFDDITIVNADVTGNIDVYGNDAIIDNSRVTSTHFWGINQRSVANNLLVDHCTILSVPGQGADNGGSDYAINSGSAGDLTVTYTDMSLFGTGVQTAVGTIEHNYIHDLQVFIPQGSPDYYHSDAIISGGGSVGGLYIHHNTLLNQISALQGGTAAVGLFADFGPQFNVVVDDNFLAGGAYTTYGGNLASHDVAFTNNKFSTIFWPNSGYYGPSAYFLSAGVNNVWSNNIWADGPSAGQAISPAF